MDEARQTDRLTDRRGVLCYVFVAICLSAMNIIIGLIASLDKLFGNYAPLQRWHDRPLDNY